MVEETTGRGPPVAPAGEARLIATAPIDGFPVATTTLIERTIVLLLVGALLFGVGLVLFPMLTAILFGTVLAIATWPLREALVGRGMRRGLAAALFAVSAALLVCLPVLVAAPRLADQFAEGEQQIDRLLKSLPDEPPAWVAGLPIVGERAAVRWRNAAAKRSDLRTTIEPYADGIRRALFAAAGSLAASVLELILAVIVAAMLWTNGDALSAVVRDIVRRLGGETAVSALVAAGAALRSVAYGIVGTAAIQGLFMAIGAIVAGVPAPGLLGFVVTLLAISQIGAVLIPVVWGGAAWWLFAQDATLWGVFMLVWGLVMVTTSDNFIRPLLIMRGVQMPLTLVILGVFGGFLSFGFLGMFIGPALLAVAFTLLQAWRTAIPPAS
ncbi:MAG: AI-2E family transporter [Alphaproteobacteria bacterium]